MPIYAYRCQSCGFAKDVLQKISDAPLTDCEACGKPTFQKQLTAPGFQLKGSGWYVTDFRDNKGSGGNNGSSSRSSASSSTSDDSGGHSCSGACSHGSDSSSS